MIGGPILETPRLRLVMWDSGDAGLIQELHSTIDTTRYLSGGVPWSIAKAEERLQELVSGARARRGHEI